MISGSLAGFLLSIRNTGTELTSEEAMSLQFDDRKIQRSGRGVCPGGLGPNRGKGPVHLWRAARR
jgi:hypothetical protein